MGFQRLDLRDRKRPGGRNVVLLYGFAKEVCSQLTKKVNEAGIDEWIVVDRSMANEVIADILENEESGNDDSCQNETEKVVLFNGISQYELHTFMELMYRIVQERPLVAVVTPVSVKWKFRDLISELIQERKELEKQ